MPDSEPTIELEEPFIQENLEILLERVFDILENTFGPTPDECIWTAHSGEDFVYVSLVSPHPINIDPWMKTLNTSSPDVYARLVGNLAAGLREVGLQFVATSDVMIIFPPEVADDDTARKLAGVLSNTDLYR